MSWLKAIAGGVIGAEALNLVKEYVEKQGGLDGVVKNFENSGLGKQVHSWIGLGPNEKISEVDISKVINADKLKEIAKNAGIDLEKAQCASCPIFARGHRQSDARRQIAASRQRGVGRPMGGFLGLPAAACRRRLRLAHALA